MQHKELAYPYLEPITLAIGGTLAMISIAAGHCPEQGLSIICRAVEMIEESTGGSVHMITKAAAFAAPCVYFFTRMYQIEQIENAERQLAKRP